MISPKFEFAAEMVAGQVQSKSVRRLDGEVVDELAAKA
jgi:hypothetical protein